MKKEFLGLEFGCGPSPRKPNYKGVDIRKFPNVEYVCNAWEITEHVEKNSVDAIYSRHFLEHLTFKQVDLTLQAWHEILKPGGEVYTIVPNMRFHIKQFLNPERASKMYNKILTEEQVALAGFWGHQREKDLTDFWDVHKSGYDFPLLRKILSNHGFKDIKKIKSKQKNLVVVAYK